MITNLSSKVKDASTLETQAIDKEVEVDFNEYSSMLISNKNLIRCDAPEKRVRGLYDPKSKTRFFIPETHLFATS